MRVLITGGTGYLGGRVAQYLTNHPEFEVYLGSRKTNTLPDWTDQLKVVKTSWDSPSALDEICKNVDAVIHMAGMNAQDCAADPSAAIEVNGVATSRLLDASIRQGVKRFIYLSTAHVYASPLEGSINEGTCPNNLHSYAASHKAGEDVTRLAHLDGKIKTVVIRLSNSFGAPADDMANCWMLLVNDLCLQAIKNKTLTLHTDGTQQRDFITLEDVSRAIKHFLTIPDIDCGDGLFNVGGECVMTIWEMANRIAECCNTRFGFKPDIKRPLVKLDKQRKQLYYEITKLKESSFYLKDNIDKEITRTLEFCVSVNKNTDLRKIKK